jgi:hypothetical protein
MELCNSPIREYVFMAECLINFTFFFTLIHKSGFGVIVEDIVTPSD